jgi:SAM-dependent methyltransferase
MDHPTTKAGGMTEATRAAWDDQAQDFDDQPDHGLLDPEVRSAWSALLRQVLPAVPARILDLGSGTGSLAVLLGERGYDVLGVDLAPRMVEQAVRKARQHGVGAQFRVGDASSPEVEGLFDALLVRHVLWALPDPSAVLDRWLRLLAPDGVLVLIEGFWHTGVGLRAVELFPLLQARARTLTWRRLTDDETLWGTRVSDERYLISVQM